MTRTASLCPHLREELDDFLEEAINYGALLNVTKAEIEDYDILTFLPADATEEERFRFAERATRYFFFVQGCKCPTCGHIARGKLAQSSREEKERWQRDLDAAAAENEARRARRRQRAKDSPRRQESDVDAN
jgi:hypothetical protein